MIKTVIFNQSENISVRFVIYILSMCVQLFTAFEESVLKLYVPTVVSKPSVHLLDWLHYKVNELGLPEF